MEVAGERRPYRWFVLATFAAIAVAGCSRPGARNAARGYLAALKGSEYRECYRMLAQKVRAGCSLEEFLRAIPLAPNVTQKWFEPLTQATDYATGPARKDGASAIVPVFVRTPNLTLWQSQLAGLHGKALQAAITTSLRNRSYPRLEYRDELVLVRERRRWRLMAEPALHGRLAALREAAVTAYHGYDFSRAAQLYRQLLALLRQSPFSGSRGLALHYLRELGQVRKAIREQPLATAYLSRLAIRDVRRERTAGGQPGIFGTVINLGSRSIDQLAIRITYYREVHDEWRQVYSEDHTVLARPLGFVDFRPIPSPLAPDARLRFGFTLEAPPEVLASSRVIMTPAALILSPGGGWPPKLAQTLRPITVAEATPALLPPLAALTQSSPHTRRQRLHHRRYHHHARYHRHRRR